MKKTIVNLLVSLLFFGTVSAVENKFEPTKNTVELVVPYPAGGATDTLTRQISAILNEQGWNSIVVNKPGADSAIGANYVAAAKPNGYTLFVGGQDLVANLAFPELSPGVEYNQDSFVPVVSMGAGSLVLAVAIDSPINNYNEFKDFVKKNPDKFKVGFWSIKSGKFFNEWARVEGLPNPTIVPYKGSSPLMVDLLGNHIEFAFDTFTATSQYYADKKLKVIASFDEAGAKHIKDINNNANIVNISKQQPELEFSIMYGLFAPKGTNDNVIKIINEAVNKGLKDKKYHDVFVQYGISDFGGEPKKLDDLYKRLQSIFKKVAIKAN